VVHDEVKVGSADGHHGWLFSHGGRGARPDCASVKSPVVGVVVALEALDTAGRAAGHVAAEVVRVAGLHVAVGAAAVVSHGGYSCPSSALRVGQGAG
jgi:hypothetical protein